MKGLTMNALQATPREIEVVENFIRTEIAALSFLYTDAAEVIARATLRWCDAARDLSEAQLDSVIDGELAKIRKVKAELNSQPDSRVLEMGTHRMEMMVKGIAMANSFEMREDIAALLIAQRISDAVENDSTASTYIHHSLTDMEYDEDSANPLHHTAPFQTECKMSTVEIINPEVAVRNFIDAMSFVNLYNDSTYETASIIRDRVPEAATFTIYSLELMVANKRVQVQTIQNELAALTDERVVELGYAGLVEMVSHPNSNINEDVIGSLVTIRRDAVVVTTSVAEAHPMFPIFQALLARRPDLYPSEGVMNFITIQHIESEYGVDVYEYQYDELLGVAELVREKDAEIPTLLMSWDVVPVMLADRGYKIIGEVQRASRASDGDLVLTFILHNEWEYCREYLTMRDLAMFIYEHLKLERTSVQVMQFTNDGIEYRIK
ncbi:hypothetical protein [Janthinobacterium sp.]|uniref:hypothetical protein n=1 Tax=Janthinobacterium sp. TaxID=1871054 RepID=UPI002601F929|nr:hypothetical protein [Janthinobacterium sp.]